MAGAGAKLFTDGSVLNAAQVNTYLMDQSIMRFATTTARDAAFGGAGEPVLAEGMTCYIDDDNSIYIYDGSNWVRSVIASSQNKLPMGMIAGTGSYATTAFAANTNLTVLSLTFDVQPNRRYMAVGRIGVQVTATPATPNALWIAQTNLGVRTLAYRTSSIPQFFCELFEGHVVFISSDLGVTTTTASRTIDMRWRCGASGALNTDPDGVVGTNSLPHQLHIIDIGSSL